MVNSIHPDSVHSCPGCSWLTIWLFVEYVLVCYVVGCIDSRLLRVMMSEYRGQSEVVNHLVFVWTLYI